MCVISVIKYVFEEKIQNNENTFEQGLKYIQYMKGKATVFEMPAYNIKSGKSWVKMGEQIHFVENEMFDWDFTISPFINGVFSISQRGLRYIV